MFIHINQVKSLQIIVYNSFKEDRKMLRIVFPICGELPGEEKGLLILKKQSNFLTKYLPKGQKIST